MHLRQGLVVGGTVPWRDVVDAATAHDYDFVELDMEQAFPPEKTDVAAVAEVLAAHDLDVVVHLPFRLDPASPTEHGREGACRELEAAIDVAADLGAETGVMHANAERFVHTWGEGALRDALYESVDRVASYGADRGVEVCVENVKDDVFDAGDFPDLFAATDASACLDTGHAFVSGFDAAAQADLLQEYPDRFSHVHLNDTRMDGDDEHLPVGLGRVDFETLVAAMAESGWSGTCTHEIYLFGLEYVGTAKTVFDGLLADAT